MEEVKKNEEKIHPSRIVENILNTFRPPMNTAMIRNVLFMNLKEKFRNVQLIDKRYILASHPIDPKITRKMVMIYVQKQPNYEIVRKFWEDSRKMIQEGDSCRMMVVQTTDGKRDLMFYMKIDYAWFNPKENKWIRVYTSRKEVV